MNEFLKKSLTAHYTFEDSSNPGKDASGNQMDAVAMGTSLPVTTSIEGRMALKMAGGKNSTSYLKLPENILKAIGIIFFLLSFMIFILIDILKGNISFKIKKEKTVIQGIPVYEMPQI